MTATIHEFTDLELFQMFNIDVGRAALQETLRLRREGKRAEAKVMLGKARKKWGNDLWYENKKQRSGNVVDDFGASETIPFNDPIAVAERVSTYAQRASLSQNIYTGLPLCGGVAHSLL